MHLTVSIHPTCEAMTHHDHGHHDHQHHTQHPKNKPLHKDWRSWLVVGLMLAAILMYVWSNDERDPPGGGPAKEMPEAAP
jgi:hypothetical protein